MLLVASGKTPPFDAGQYSVCKGVEEETQGAVQTKFFIAHLNDWGVLPGVAGEVGLCLPKSCRNEDVPDVVSLLAMKIPALRNASFSRHYTGDSWPAPKGTVLFPNPFNDEDDLSPWGPEADAVLALLAALGVLVAFSTACVHRAERVRRRRLALLEGRGAFGGEASPDAGGGGGSGACGGSGGGGGGAMQRPPPRALRGLPSGFAWCEIFSLIGERGTLAALRPKAEERRPTDCLDGIKVVGMFFIILGHGCLQPMNVAGYRNAASIPKSILSPEAFSTRPETYVLLSGQLFVDTFLFISGFLLSYVGRRRNVRVFLGTLLRYCRLLPLFGLTTLIYICLAPYATSGPFAPRLQSDVFESCKGLSWLSQLLLVSDWYPWYTLNGGCMGWSWYLSIDMTFAVIGMVLLKVWQRRELHGWLLAGGLFLLCIGLTIQQALYHELTFHLVDPSFAVYTHYLYTRPYARFPGFCVGLVAPWALAALERRGIRGGAATPPSGSAGVGGGGDVGGRARASLRLLLVRLLATLWALVWLAAMAAIVLLPMRNMDGPGPKATARSCADFACWTRLETALYIALSRPLWALCWLALALSCYFDLLPALDGLLSAPFFRPLSNLTFGAYLLHPVIIKVLAARRTDYYVFSYEDAVGRAVWYSLLAYAAAVVAWCLVERPCAVLVSKLVSRQRPAACAAIGPAPVAPPPGQSAGNVRPPSAPPAPPQ